MNHFCIITNSDKDENNGFAQEMKAYLEKQGRICDLLENKLVMEKGVRHFTDAGSIHKDTQCAIVLGGDGTMIQAAIDLVHTNIPILGVNMGTMGFLTELETQNIYPALDALMKSQYSLETRIMLKATPMLQKGKVVSNHSCYALNDIVISKRGTCRLITIRVYINGDLADVYRADGLIVSTPTGSTGYNLSAGGPVMVPHTHVMVITPICPHSLNKRSLVLAAGDRIILEIGQAKEAEKETAELVVDGRNAEEFISGDRIAIKVPEEVTQLIKISPKGFFKRMRDKLNGE